MGSVEQHVARNYTHGSLESAILAGLEEFKKLSDTAEIDQLASVDEFHIGGRAATMAVAEQLRLSPGLRVLDVGCGLGGTARFLATVHGCDVAGVDITREFVEVGERLNRRLGLDGRIKLSVANGQTIPYEDSTFDRSTMLHVGMNVADKTSLFSEIARVTKPGGYFAVYDVMLTGNRKLAYPVAWAQDEATSFLASPDAYRRALEASGFAVLEQTSKRDFALEFFKKLRARLAEGAPPPLGLHIVMGKSAPQKVANMYAGVESGVIAPVQMLARRE